MTRLRRLAVLALVLCARPAAARPSESEIVSAARARVAACANGPMSASACRDAQGVLSGYLLLLKTAEDCAAKPCLAATVTSLFYALRTLDEAEHKLPDPARADATGRPLLRLSLLVGQRAAAALAAADPQAKVPVRFDPPVDAPRAVEEACLDYPGACSGARSALSGALDLKGRIDACEAKPCAFEALDAAATKAEDAMGTYQGLRVSGGGLLTVFSLINDDQARLALILIQDAAARLARLRAGQASLTAGLDGFEKGAAGADAAGLEARVGDLTGLYREASLSSDRASSFLLGGEKTGAQRAQLNEAAAALAASRSRLLALETARGLKAPDAGAAGPGPAGGGRATLGLTLGPAAAPALLDRRTIPAPAPRDGRAPPILEKAPGVFELMGNLNSADPVKRADARRRLGLSATVGDPTGRAALVHSQQYPDTCAVVSQQEVLGSLHLLPTGDPNAQETALREEAKSRGFYRQGTPDYYTADLLIDRGVLVAKRSGAPLSELDAAVRRGGLVIANVDARYLWGVPATGPMGHAIVVTGAEVDRISGETAGYYVNDSGTNPPGRGRFVPRETFRKAWDAHTRSYAEVK